MGWAPRLATGRVSALVNGATRCRRPAFAGAWPFAAGVWCGLHADHPSVEAAVLEAERWAGDEEDGEPWRATSARLARVARAPQRSLIPVQSLSLAAEPDSLETVRRAVTAALERGGLVVYPTETFYGLGVGLASPAAFERLFAVKGRDRTQPIPFIAEDLAAVERVAALDERAERLAEAFWPGPLTLVLEAKATFPAGLASASRTIAVRVSSHPIARVVAAAAGGIVTSTSANRSGHPPSSHYDVVRRDLSSNLDSRDLIIEAEPTTGGAPSTIVDASGPVARCVREGAVSWSRVLEFLR